MKQVLKLAMALAALFVFCGPALAFDLGGFYVAPKVMWSQEMHDDTKVRHDGWTFPTMTSYKAADKQDDTWGGALAVGYNLKPRVGVPVRVELEGAVRYLSRIRTQATDTAHSDSYDLRRASSVSTLFANAYYDIDTGTAFTPYVGAGVGVAFITLRDIVIEGVFGRRTYTRQDLTNFAWNVGAGVAYSFNANWAADLGYRYSSFGECKGGTGTENVGTAQAGAKSDITAHEVMLGVRYSF